MFRKFVITLLAYMLLTINANAGSDGELVLKKINSRSKRLF